MAKKQAGEAARTTATKALPTMEDEFDVPKELVMDAEDYATALKAKGKANGKFNSARDKVIASMRDLGVERIRIQTDKGEKTLVLSNEDKLKLEKLKKPDVDEE